MKFSTIVAAAIASLASFTQASDFVLQAVDVDALAACAPYTEQIGAAYAAATGHDKEWEALHGGRALRGDSAARELNPYGSTCQKNCKGFMPGSCYLVWPQCYPCKCKHLYCRERSAPLTSH